MQHNIFLIPHFQVILTHLSNHLKREYYLGPFFCIDNSMSQALMASPVILKSKCVYLTTLPLVA